MTNAAANDIRDIKPPIAIPNGWEWLWWTLGALAVLTLLLLAWRYFLKRVTQVSVEPPVPAHIRAKQKLEEALALISQPKQFCVLVSDTIRFYLEERFQFRAPERTTEEFLRELGGTDLLSPEQKESLGNFLESCDLVKFAKYEPRESELRELHSSALRLIEETEPKETKIPQIDKQQIPPFESIALQIQKPRPTNGKKFAIAGVILQLGNSAFFFAYVVGLMREIKFYQELPSKVAQEMSTNLDHLLSTFSQPPKWVGEQQDIWNSVLITSGIGALVGIAGLVLIIIALTKQQYRAEWLFWFLLIYGLILLTVIPLGTIIGIFFLVYCLTKRREFLNRT